MKVHILTVGDEILIGQTVDTNSAWLGKQLNKIGAEVIEITSVPDDHNRIIEGMEHASANADVVLMTGGLGPTKDDITKKAIADFFGVKMVFLPELFERIKRIAEKLGYSVTDAHHDQCFLPENAELLKNKMGSAPGMWFEKEKKVFISMPGVPYEMQHIAENEVFPRLKEKFQGVPILHYTFLTAGVGETELASILRDFEAGLPAHIKLAYLPSICQVKLRLTGRGGVDELLRGEMEQWKDYLYTLIGQHVFGDGEETLQQAIGKMLSRQKLNLVTAESCTGGYLAHLITQVPGASDYYTGSILAYSNELKKSLLEVSEATLQNFGAVSEETVVEMVKGVLKLPGADIAIATSGIAGPGGGTPEKPVGTIWIALGNSTHILTHKLKLGKDRQKNIEYTSIFSLDLLRKFLLQITEK